MVSNSNSINWRDHDTCKLMNKLPLFSNNRFEYRKVAHDVLENRNFEKYFFTL